MEHLSVEEIIEFASIEELNEETEALSKKVTLHIRCCGECLKRVQAYQTLYAELGRAVLEKYSEKAEAYAEDDGYR